MQIKFSNEEENIKSGVCYIIGGGKIISGGWLYGQVKPGPDDYVIAADKGYATCTECGIPINLVLGDFDSLGYVPVHPNLIRLATEKDDTDMLYAIKKGLELGYRMFQIYGGTGGRPDHTLANYQCLSYLASNGACGILCSPGVRTTVIKNDTIKLPAYDRGLVSVFCMGEKAENVVIEGLKYSMNHATMTNDCPIGVSNEFIGKPSTISVENGALLIMWELVVNA
ncbi:MAG: thiamine diphosphokinase [Lachnospiraceae bacterium]|nr:thiamine diphosphokinase [Candidatus Merdinaster equi]